MIVPDTNLLIYAHDLTAPAHGVARKWWEDALSGTEPVGVPWVVVLAFVRLMTHPTLSENPMTVEQARQCVEGWLEQPVCRVLPTGPGTVDRFFDLLRRSGAGGNRCTDALIAAAAEENGGTVYSSDRDFDRFEGIRWQNPLAA
jgi:toxin-antitoxin system PIN domain toxin